VFRKVAPDVGDHKVGLASMTARRPGALWHVREPHATDLGSGDADVTEEDRVLGQLDSMDLDGADDRRAGDVERDVSDRPPRT
jgi:hypothetical protein